MADLGSYVLFVECGSPIAVDVGALGEREFLPGTYAYVGSAFGPGGLSRVERHRRVAVGDHNVRHWPSTTCWERTEHTSARSNRFPIGMSNVRWQRHLRMRGVSRSIRLERPTATV